MLADKDVMATVAVRDLAKARKFYEGVLGLKQAGEGDAETIVYQAGASKLLVYRSQFAGTNRATAATWTVGGEIETVVRALKEAGVTFEHYDMPDTKLQGDLHIAGTMEVAWFKDPDGNILAIVNG